MKITSRTFAALAGGLYLALGVLGFVPAVWESPPRGGPAVTVRVFYASLFGLFTVNIVLSMVHLVVGLDHPHYGQRPHLAQDVGVDAAGPLRYYHEPDAELSPLAGHL